MQPISTYRLQINSAFDLFDAAEVADYVHRLGADWLYLSPLLSAHEGSDHGYDVVDHRHVDPARGGPDGLDAVAWAARRHDLGILVDIVPNHVGVGTSATSTWWNDVLTHGQASRYAPAFDIDWEFGDGKVRIPVLGDEEQPQIAIDGDGVRYGSHLFPLAPDTVAGAAIADVLAAQHYELINWRRADADLNYRRFFAVNTLAGIRVEEPWVFEESHAEIVRWVGQGLVSGLRVDHPDGLADPGGYLDALAAATDRTYVVVEKILQPVERLPSAWASAGTTGYDALAEFDRVLIDPDGQAPLDEIDAAMRAGDEPVRWTDLIHDTKREVADGILRSEVRRIARELLGALNCQERALEDAVAELLACFPVYRSYLPVGVEHLDRAAELAKRHRPDLAATLDLVHAVLVDPQQPAARRFQQTSGMVMAKGVEDCAFYRYTRLGSLTEVGGDPSEFSIDVDEFHHRQQVRHSSFPHGQTTLTTHDTKRGEDVRARLNVLAERPLEWGATLAALRSVVPISDGSFEQLVWQAVIGSWPASRERLHAYAEKAAREAGRSTNWTDPSPVFEQSVHRAIDSVFDDAAVQHIVDDFVALVEMPGWINGLSAKLLQLSAPGVPDVYQGSELWQSSLVDPDNRRPVDFPLLRRVLDQLDAGYLPPIDAGGAAKLLVTSRALRLRRDHRDWYSLYRPVQAVGRAAQHVIAFDRGAVVALATRLPVGLQRIGGWADTSIALAKRPMVDVITGRRFEGGLTSVGELFERYPVALLGLADERPS